VSYQVGWGGLRGSRDELKDEEFGVAVVARFNEKGRLVQVLVPF